MSDRHFVLVVSRNLPPAATGSAVIVGNLARAFSRDEMLLAGRRPGATPPAQMATDRPEVVYLEGCQDWQSRIPGGRHLPLATVPWLTRRLVRLMGVARRDNHASPKGSSGWPGSLRERVSDSMTVGAC